MLIIKEKWDNPKVKWIEDDCQAAIVTCLYRIEKYFTDKGLELFTFAGDMNGMFSSPKIGAKGKALGMRRGETDLRFYLQTGRIWLAELKMKNNGLSKEQKERHPLLRRMGYDVTVHYCMHPMDGCRQIIEGLAKRIPYATDEMMVIANFASKGMKHEQ